jgi:TRAP-type C4-dicarboxylate transport system permease small subunit
VYRRFFKEKGVQKLKKTIEHIFTLGAFSAGALLLFVTFSISYSILSRALGFNSPVWIVQFNEYALLWITFLGTTWVLARGKHVSIDLLTGQFSQRRKTGFRLFHGVLGTIVCLVFVWYGFWTTFGQYQRGITDVQAVDMPKYLILMIIPVGFFLLAIQFIRQIYNTWSDLSAGLDTEQFENRQDVSIDQGPE